jgi:4-oxalocrotonate tautomerase
MPFITLNTTHPLRREQLATIAQQLTGLTARVLRKDPALTVVRIAAGPEYVTWFAAGALLPGDQPLAQLSITITAGANTVQEKTDWQHEAWKLLRAIWDDSVLPNYVSVVELPGTDWGYNGLPQANRKEMKTCMQKS